MKPLKLLVISAACAIASIVGVFAWLGWNAPAESPGYGKAVMLIWPILAFIAFGVLWPVAVGLDCLIARLRGRPRVPSEIDVRLLVVIAAALFCHSVYRIYPVAADEVRKRQLLRIATDPRMDQRAATELTDAYLEISQAGIRNGGYREAAFVALLQNPATSPSVIEKIGLGLSSDSHLWQILAKHPLLPPSVIERRILDPQVGGQLAQNPKLPSKYLRMLAESPDHNVRRFVSRNVSTPKESLEKLAQERDSTIRDFARQNLAGTLGIFAYK